MSAARRRTPAPTSTGDEARTVAPSLVASSTATTASAPSGSTPPVAIEAAAPGGSGGGIVAGRDREGDRQLAVAVGRAQREAVERGVVPARQVDERVMRTGRHAADRGADRDVLGREPRAGRAETGARVVQPE